MNHHSALTAAPLNSAVTSVTSSPLSAAKGAIGFKGYLMDHVSDCYYLGNGYRLYDPRMRAFYSPDSLSPFGAAGLNRYQYCHLDPVNLKDPTGHIPVTFLISLSAMLIGVGLHIGASYWRKQGQTAYADYLDTIGLGFDIGSLVTPVGIGLARAGASVIARSVARAATRQAGRTLQKMVARARLRTVLERGAPTDATPDFQYLPYTSGKIESITLNNSTQFMATEQLTGCAVTVSRTGGAIRVSHVAANVMDSQTWRLSHTARHILREETYGEIASFAGARSGNTWVFGYQSYAPTRTGIAARSGAPVFLPW
ncbi:RHS repeat-associated core domain-containing protein [Pseudomonas fluorescens]|uniref:RHS repeat-associated core domain-containing protein n=1 Tax=Pseudomonas fluorescens TaxID=294 RepID=UPI0011303014|nr:RHS repeat-associated core domain-containing protein [Pseudomonas fluorescens]TMU74675.1 RHS repeat-associated core domain-containing protein [Pseudomonas fluorescens]